MNFNQLTYFLRVSELGGFTRASRALGVAQPVLSRQVRQLEVELGQSLLERNGRGVTATQAGLMMMQHARGILRQIERAHEDMDRVRGGAFGRAVLGMPPTPSRVFTVLLVRRFREALPNARLSIREQLSHVLAQWLLAGQLDIALLYDPPPIRSITLEPLATEPLYLVGTDHLGLPAGPVALETLPDYPLVIPTRPHTIRTSLETQMALIGCRPTIRLEVEGVPATLDLVADGVGYAVLSQPAVRSSAHPGIYRTRQIINPSFSTHLYLATAIDRTITSAQRAAIDIIRTIARSSSSDASDAISTGHDH